MPLPKKPADWSNDPPEMVRGRKGYWLTGFGTGPDTIMGVIWGGALLAVAATDGTCHPFEGLSSGADGSSCVPHGDWNESFFSASGGAACIGQNLLGQSYYKHDASNADCASAFAAYASTDSLPRTFPDKAASRSAILPHHCVSHARVHMVSSPLSSSSVGVLITPKQFWSRRSSQMAFPVCVRLKRTFAHAGSSAS